jgi:hypothetical protein
MSRLYVDNATPLIDPDWQRTTVAQMTAHRPKIIMLDNFAPNGTERSRFDVWATDVMAYIRQRYERRKVIGPWEILVRRDDGG